MEIVEASLNGIPLLKVTGEVDHSTSPVLSAAIQKVLSQERSRLLLDLSECPYLDSGGLAVILATVLQVRTEGWLGVIGVNANVLRLLTIVGLTAEQCLRLFASATEASRALAGNE